MVSLKVEEDHELNIVSMAVSRISTKRHFWGYKLRSWYLGFWLCLELKIRVLTLKMTLELSA